MPHLAYLGQILEKGGGFAVGIFPEGWVLSRDCHTHIFYTWHDLGYCDTGAACFQWCMDHGSRHLAIAITV